MIEFKIITLLEAYQFPEEVERYCVENEIPTHYQNDVIYIKDDGNVFAEWLKKEGHVFKNNTEPFAILST